MRRRSGARTAIVAMAAVLSIQVLGIPAAHALAPTITSFTPTSGPIGTVVTITGTNFTNPDVTAVTFNGVPATFTPPASDTSMTASVPTGATDGPIAVTNADGTATSATNFDVTPSPVPTITSFTPTSGAVGTAVTITGTGFTGATAVTFGGVAATTFTVDSDTQIAATVPTGAMTGPIAVTTPGGTATSTTDFTVTEPVEHDRNVTLGLQGHLVAAGIVSSRGADECAAQVRVRIQRRVEGEWKNVGSDMTNGAGRFRDRVKDKEGRYRAFVRQTPAEDGICLEARSRGVRHTHGGKS